jgi:hypothetical protein
MDAIRLIVLAMILPAMAALADKEKPLTPVEARQKVGEEVVVEMTVATSKDRLEKRGEIYLDSETDFKDPKNFAVVISKDGAKSLKDAGIASPAEHFLKKKIRAKGKVELVQDVPRINIHDAKQLEIVPGN